MFMCVSFVQCKPVLPRCPQTALSKSVAKSIAEKGLTGQVQTAQCTQNLLLLLIANGDGDTTVVSFVAEMHLMSIPLNPQGVLAGLLKHQTPKMRLASVQCLKQAILYHHLQALPARNPIPSSQGIWYCRIAIQTLHQGPHGTFQ